MERFNFKFQGHWSTINSCYFEIYAAGIGYEFMNKMETLREKIEAVAAKNGCAVSVSDPIYGLHPICDTNGVGLVETIGVATMVVNMIGANSDAVKTKVMTYLPL